MYDFVSILTLKINGKFTEFAAVGEAGWSVKPLPSGLVGSNPTTPTKFINNNKFYVLNLLVCKRIF